MSEALKDEEKFVNMGGTEATSRDSMSERFESNRNINEHTMTDGTVRRIAWTDHAKRR